ELDGRGRALEIGVGTGRIALPVVEAGIPLTGIDLSLPMLQRLVEKTERGAPRFSLGIADATTLPFHDDAFGAAYAVHVLHLIPAWRDAIAELVRVVRPGGVILFDVGTPPPKDDALQQATERFMREADIERRHPGLEDDQG